jgi:hypothetical protein
MSAEKCAIIPTDGELMFMREIVLVHRDLLKEPWLPLWIKTIIQLSKVPKGLTCDISSGKGGKTIYAIQREDCEDSNVLGELDHPNYVIWLRAA